MSSSPVEARGVRAGVGSISGISHYGIQVADLDRSLAFYEHVLGFEVVGRWVKNEQFIQELVAYPGLEVHVAVLRVPGCESFFEILDYRNVERTPVDPATANPGTAHVCFYVDELDDLYERLLEAGVEFLSEPKTPLAGPNAGGRVVYLVDPDGIRIELLQTELTFDGEPRRRAAAASP
jgi:lactoylglutathione lyase